MVFAQLALVQRWCPWCDGHMGWGGWGMMLVWWLLLIAIVGAILWVLLRRGRGIAGPGRDPAEDALRERFARGEIDEETYRTRLDELRRRP